MSKKALAKRVTEDIVRVARELGRVPSEEEYLTSGGAFSKDQLSLAFSSYTMGLRAAGLTPDKKSKPDSVEKRTPKILLFDLETAPMRLFGFGLFDQNFGINQIDEDWFLLSFAAKWLDNPAIYYADQSGEPDVRDDRVLLMKLWHLLDEADVVITQNGKSFDEKVANARFIIQEIPPPSPFKHIDTKILAKRRFRFTSNKLEYLAEALNVAHKKLKHKKFPGFELWRAIMKAAPETLAEAWAEMKEYNIADVLSLEGIYLRLRPWGVGINLNAYTGDNVYRCQCGSSDFVKRGFERTKSGKFQRFTCKGCGAWHQASGADNNYMSGAKKSSINTPVGGEGDGFGG